MRTENGSVLAELMAMQHENPVEAKQRFNELTPEELNVLSLELGARLTVDLCLEPAEVEVVESRAA